MSNQPTREVKPMAPAGAGGAAPPWRLPQGVPRGVWDYAHAEHIAFDYDQYFAGNSLFEFDLALLERQFSGPGTLVDLGCGTGRLLVPFARRGFRAVAVDLSRHMLEVVTHKSHDEGLAIDRVCANLAELDCLADGTADYAICMFSTLGMLRGKDTRGRALCHVRRILKPGGKFVLHVHNRWHNLSHSQGRRWLLCNLIRARVRRDQEPGDKYFPYRGIPNFYLHVFTKSELKRDLKSAGFRIVEIVALDTARRHALKLPWLFGRLRANGWIVTCLA